MEYNYKNILNNGRERKSSIERKNNIEEFYSDRSRIIYCSAFRRLQQKAYLNITIKKLSCQLPYKKYG